MICLKNGGRPDTCILYTQKKSLQDLRDENMYEDRISFGRDLFYNFMHEGIFDKIKKVLFTEKFLWSLDNLFAGTTDFGFSDHEGNIILVDFKSASGIRGEEIVNKYKKQLAAYTISFEELHKRKVKEAQVWISHKNGVQIEILKDSELDEKKNEFIQLSKDFHSQWNVDPFKEYYMEIKNSN